MALVACPECKKEISDKSISCPNCGFPMNEFTRNQLKTSTPPLLPSSLPTYNLENKETPTKSTNRKVTFFHFNNIANILLTIVSLSILGLIFHGVTNVKTEPKKTLTSLSKDSQVEPKINYLQTTSTNMINTYKNNEVRADNIYRDSYIEITGVVDSVDSDISNNAVINLASKNEYEFNFVMASGDLDFQKKAININKGQIITLRCIGGGEIIGNPVLNECEFK